MKYLHNPNLPFHPATPTNWQGNPFEGKEFKYEGDPFRPDWSVLLRMIFSANPQRKEKKEDKWVPEVTEDVAYLNDRSANWIVWLGARLFWLMHHGTYDLSNEPASEPITWARREMKEAGLEERLVQLAVAEAWWF